MEASYQHPGERAELLRWWQDEPDDQPAEPGVVQIHLSEIVDAIAPDADMGRVREAVGVA